MDLELHLLQAKDAMEILDFEKENRDYFNQTVPDRGRDYFQLETFLFRHQQLLEEQKRGVSYFYLIKDEKGQLLGRMNLVDIDRKQALGHVGFRVGESVAGKGIARQALRLLQETASDIKIMEAKTTTHNRASQRVLELCGFKKTYEEDKPFLFNGQEVRFVHFRWER